MTTLKNHYDDNITIRIMNVKYICLNAIQIKVSSAVAYDFNQLIYALAPPQRFRPLSRPALPHPIDFWTYPAPPSEKMPFPPIPAIPVTRVSLAGGQI